MLNIQNINLIKTYKNTYLYGINFKYIVKNNFFIINNKKNLFYLNTGHVYGLRDEFLIFNLNYVYINLHILYNLISILIFKRNKFLFFNLSSNIKYNNKINFFYKKLKELFYYKKKKKLFQKTYFKYKNIEYFYCSGFYNNNFWINGFLANWAYNWMIKWKRKFNIFVFPDIIFGFNVTNNFLKEINYQKVFFLSFFSTAFNPKFFFYKNFGSFLNIKNLIIFINFFKWGIKNGRFKEQKLFIDFIIYYLLKNLKKKKNEVI